MLNFWQALTYFSLIIRHYKNKNLFDKSGRFDRLSNSPDGYNEACNFNVAASNELVIITNLLYWLARYS